MKNISDDPSLSPLRVNLYASLYRIARACLLDYQDYIKYIMNDPHAFTTTKSCKKHTYQKKKKKNHHQHTALDANEQKINET